MNLLLARAVQRDRELGVRAALGAGAERLVRQQLTESAVVTLAGSALGVSLAALAVPLIARLVPTTLPVADVPGIDARLVGIAALVTAVTAIGFGLLPAVRVSRATSFEALRGGPRAGTSRGAERVRSALVVAEVAASVVLLVGAGLLLNALWRVQRIDPGFRPEGVLTMRTALPLPAYATAANKRAFYDRVLSDVRALPGVTSAAYTSFLPMVMRGGIWPVTPEGQADDPAAQRSASLRLVTPGYFETLGIPLLQGRDIRASDARTTPFEPDERGLLTVTAVVSDSFVRKYLPPDAALGHRFRMQFMDATVVGVVGDVKVRGLERESEPQVYLPSAEIPDGALAFYAPKDLAIRTTGDPLALAPAVRSIVARADPLQSVSDVRTLAEVVETETGVRRTQLRVLGLFAGVAALLAAVGIHGLLAYLVSARTREIGVRIALGATRGAVLRLVMGRGILLAGVGAAIGVVAATAAGNALQALLAGVSPADPLTVAGAVTLSLAMAVAGSVWPAVRAVRVDPIQATRAE
jgi:predicted permease